MLQDMRYAIRLWHSAKGWTAVVVLSLAVGIGANAAIFTAVNGVLLKQLPVRDPGSLVRLRWVGKNDMANDTSDYGSVGQTTHATFSYPMFQHFRASNQTLTDLAASRPAGVTATIDGRAETASALLVTGNYHGLLGITAQIGRTLTPEDDSQAAPAVATLSDRYWRSRFAADPGVLGKTIRINKVPITIVGVTEPSFTGTQRLNVQLQDLTMPVKIDDQITGDAPRLSDATAWWVQITARLKPGITAAQVRGNLEPVFQRQARAGLDAYLASSSEEVRGRSENQQRTAVPRLVVDSGSRGTYEAGTSQVSALAILGAVVALVLLLVCANVANLLLARTAARQREISVRMSIGATRFRVIRQLLTESLLLAGVGGVAGMLIARWGQAFLPPPVGTAAPAVWRVGAFTATVTALSGVVFGIAPALRATRADVSTSLKDNSRSIAASNTVLARALLITQVTISVLLLVGAGLFLKTLNNLRNVDIGFDPQNLVFVRVDAEGSGLSDERKFQFLNDAIARIKAVPGVKDATLSNPTPLSGGGWENAMFVQGREYTAYVEERDSISRVVASPNYFATMGIRLVSGRVFTERDHQKAPEVAMINDAAARKFFPNDNPIGRRFGMSLDNTDAIEIVGVVRDARYNSLREAPPPTLYLPHLQRDPEDLVFTVRTAVDPAGVMSSLRSAVSQADPNIPVVAVETQMSQIERRFAQEKVLAQAYALFGGIALFIAAIGLFGLMSYNVARRTREIGIRVALGAERQEVLGLVLRESMMLVFAGIVIGIAAALGTGRLIASQLFGLEPTDATTIVTSVAVMALVAAAAGYLPARRATRVDPVVALRYE